LRWDAWKAMEWNQRTAASAGHLAQAALLVFGCLAFAPSKKCCCCLLSKFGLTQFAARLFRGLADERHLAFNIFDALSPHPIAVAYSGPINTAAHCDFPRPNETVATQGGNDKAQRSCVTVIDGHTICL